MTVGGVLKSIGKVLFFVSFVLFSCGELFATEVKTELSDSTIHVGESTTLKIMISGATSDIHPVSVPGIKNLKIEYRGLSRSFQYINGDVWSGVIMTFQVIPEKTGKYKIPPFVFNADGKQFSSSPVMLNVLKSLGKIAERSGGGGLQQSIVRSDIELSKKSVYAGEPLIMRYYLYSNGANLFELNGMERSPNTKGFVVKEIAENLPDSVESIEGVEYVKQHIATFCLIPTEAGLHKPGGGAAIITLNSSESLLSFGQRKRITFPTKKIDVKKLPLSGKPANYGGDVGDFKLEVEIPKGEFKQFDEVSLEVTVFGRGNLLTLSKPRLSRSDVKAIFEKQGEELLIHKEGISGKKKFSLSIVPQKAGELDLGRVVLDFYNPERGKYETVESEPLVLNIAKGLDASQSGEVKLEENKKNFKFDFKIVFAMVALFFIILGGVMWERKRLRRYERVSEESRSVAEETPVEVSEGDEVFAKDSYNKNELLTLKDLEKALAELAKSHDGEELKKYIDSVEFARYGGGFLSEERFYEIRSWIEARRGK